ncbi:hypothetical protein UFOVP733_20 [uncultured Caudovirales phage]|uniref:Uncharacterized protein n=1 Tax=uncultured Caudovirales phage TaxID=2100421 RepID=A0A6J7XBC8_9CAUD|nr:hypothetical protein UFOVP733_20 [uncultured Caudovirales phage]CAB5224928.1 hypothetical protein UFOVP743_39 [uncultured Caudovirales phage]
MFGCGKIKKWIEFRFITLDQHLSFKEKMNKRIYNIENKIEALEKYIEIGYVHKRIPEKNKELKSCKYCGQNIVIKDEFYFMYGKCTDCGRP